MNLTAEQKEFLERELNLTEEEIKGMDKEQWTDIREKCFMIEGDEAPVDFTPISDRGRIAADITDITFKKLHEENEEEARNNMFEDDDLFDDSLPREEIIEQVRNVLIEYAHETLLDLSQYEFKNVVVTCTDGEVVKGYVDAFCEAEDNDENEASICILPQKEDTDGVEIYESEIKTIEIVE